MALKLQKEEEEVKQPLPNLNKNKSIHSEVDEDSRKLIAQIAEMDRYQKEQRIRAEEAEFEEYGIEEGDNI